MKKEIEQNERILIAGANGMVGKSIERSLLKAGYGKKENPSTPRQGWPGPRFWAQQAEAGGFF